MTKPFVDAAAVAHLARAAGIEIAPERWGIVADRLNEMFALAADMESIPYHDLPPALVFEPGWPLQGPKEEIEGR